MRIPKIVIPIIFSTIVILGIVMLLIPSKIVDPPINNTNSSDTVLSWKHLSSSTGEIPTPTTNGNQQTASMVLDIDKDGIDDMVVTDRSTTPSVVWYKKTATGWDKYVIDNNPLTIEAGGDFYDIDNDGDLDISFAGDWQSNKIWWWENPYPNKENWVRREIKNTGSKQHHDQIFGDFDNDGKTELVFWNQGANGLFIAEIPTNPRTSSSWTFAQIYTYTGTATNQKLEGFAKIDVDGDGKLDIVGGGLWFKHNSGTSFTANPIDASRKYTRAATGQFIPGGYAEVLFVEGDAIGRLIFYTYNNGVWQGKDLLGFDVLYGHSIRVADINKDGHLDIFLGEMSLHNANPRSWILYGDGKGNFKKSDLSSGIDHHESRLGDLDGDGDLDIMGKPYNGNAPRIDVWLQEKTTKLSLTNWQYKLVDNARVKYGISWYEYFGIYIQDITGDGLGDIVSGKYVYKNPGGDMTNTWTRTILPIDADGALIVNIDNDEFADIIGFGLPNIYWFEADNIQATSWTTRKTITLPSTVKTEHMNPQGWRIADLTGDGKPEILFEAGNAATAGIYALTTDTWTITRLTSAGGDGIGIGDIDGDGRLDLAIGQKNVKWYQNPGTLTLWTGYNVGDTDVNADRFNIADIDGDGLQEIIVAEETYPNPDTFLTKAYIFKSSNPKSGSWTRSVLAEGYGFQSMDVTDMDNDGDNDIILGEHKPPNRIMIYENDGKGQFIQRIVSTGKESHGLFITDINNDGKKDIAHIGWKDFTTLHLWINKG